MKRALRLLTATLSAFLLLAVGQFNHVAAMQMPHDMSGMSHGTSSSTSQNCATLCASSLIYKQEDVSSSRVEEDEEEPEPHYYIQFLATTEQLDCLHSQKPCTPDLPLKVPIHIRLGVIRS